MLKNITYSGVLVMTLLTHTPTGLPKSIGEKIAPQVFKTQERATAILANSHVYDNLKDCFTYIV